MSSVRSWFSAGSLALIRLWGGTHVNLGRKMTRMLIFKKSYSETEQTSSSCLLISLGKLYNGVEI